MKNLILATACAASVAVSGVAFAKANIVGFTVYNNSNLALHARMPVGACVLPLPANLSAGQVWNTPTSSMNQGSCSVEYVASAGQPVCTIGIESLGTHDFKISATTQDYKCTTDGFSNVTITDIRSAS